MHDRLVFLIDTLSKIGNIPVELHHFLEYNFNFFEKISDSRKLLIRLLPSLNFSNERRAEENKISQQIIDEFEEWGLTVISRLAELFECAVWSAFSHSPPPFFADRQSAILRLRLAMTAKIKRPF